MTPSNTQTLAISVVAMLGCGSSRESARASDTLSAVAEVAATAPTASSTPSTKNSQCPPTGAWALCSVEKRLKQAGFVPRKGDMPGPKRPGFSVAPTTYALGHSTLEVFLYPNAQSLGRDWAELDTVTASPRGQKPVWQMAPTLLRSANLAAVFLTDSPTQADRLTLALTAGPPQPGSGASMTRTVLPAVQIKP
jgi:hypothetical protein